jgi:hypothetical protein
MRRRYLLAAAASLGWLLAHLGAYGTRTDWAALTRGYLAIGTAFAALWPGRFGLGIGTPASSTWAVLSPLAFWLAALGARTPYLAPFDPQRALHIWLCLDITLSFAALPLLALALSLRHVWAGPARLRATLLGASAGLWAGATMNLHCPNVDGLHVALGHGVPVLLATLFGTVVLARTARA